MVDEADEDGSGSINFPEFVGLMVKKQEGGITRDEIKQVYRFHEFFSLDPDLIDFNRPFGFLTRTVPATFRALS